jgi:hypothetical protein
VSMVWKDGALRRATIYSKRGGSTTVVWGGKQRRIVLKKGGETVITES